MPNTAWCCSPAAKKASWKLPAREPKKQGGTVIGILGGSNRAEANAFLTVRRRGVRHYQVWGRRGSVVVKGVAGGVGGWGQGAAAYGGDVAVVAGAGLVVDVAAGAGVEVVAGRRSTPGRVAASSS